MCPVAYSLIDDGAVWLRGLLKGSFRPARPAGQAKTRS